MPLAPQGCVVAEANAIAPSRAKLQFGLHLRLPRPAVQHNIQMPQSQTQSWRHLYTLPQLTTAKKTQYCLSFQNLSNCVTWMRFPSGLTALQVGNALAEGTAYLCLLAQRIDKFWHVKSTCVS